jgi:hypothetical protein
LRNADIGQIGHFWMGTSYPFRQALALDLKVSVSLYDAVKRMADESPMMGDTLSKNGCSPMLACLNGPIRIVHYAKINIFA